MISAKDGASTVFGFSTLASGFVDHPTHFDVDESQPVK